jgi:hypothetical protein
MPDHGWVVTQKIYNVNADGGVLTQVSNGRVTKAPTGARTR